MQHQPLGADARPLRERASDGGSEAETANIEPVDLEFREEVEEHIGHRAGRMPPGQRWRGPVAGEIGNDQRPIGAKLAEPATKLLGRAEEAVTQD